MVANLQDINLVGGDEQAPPPASTSTIESLPYSTVTAQQIGNNSVSRHNRKINENQPLFKRILLHASMMTQLIHANFISQLNHNFSLIKKSVSRSRKLVKFPLTFTKYCKQIFTSSIHDAFICILSIMIH